MCDPIKSIATRLRGLREVLELSEQEVADSCRLSVDEYRDMESGDADISVNVLQTIARRYGISLDVLMFGEEPKMNSYFITRAGTGADAPMHLNCHKGQEMNYVLEGRLLISVSGKELVLGVGDSLYFDSGLPHGMKALDGKPVRFLAIIM